MTDEQMTAIGEFFAAAEKLKGLGIIRSDKYLGDIAEFLAVSQFGMTLASSGREPGHDGIIEGRKVQVKFNGGTSKNIECGNPDDYDELIVVLGPNSIMRRPDITTHFAIYRIPSDTVRGKTPHKDNKRRLAKGDLPSECLITEEP
ncbi:DUF6998 domain-containing protein [Corallococcus terminator]